MDITLIFNQAYYIKFPNITERYYNNYIKPNLNNIIPDTYERNLVAISENKKGEDVGVFFLRDGVLKELISFCTSEDLIVEHYCISNQILQDTISDETVKEMTESDEFNHLFETFIRKNLKVDDVLQKISNNKGYILTEIDKEILENAGE